MLFHLSSPAVLLGLALGLLGAVLAHNLGQVLVARALGDPEPVRQGWLSGKPARQLDPFAAVGMVLVGNGWPAPVPMSERWRARRGRLALALATGPVAALLTGLLWMALARLASVQTVLVGYDRSGLARAVSGSGFRLDAILLAAASAACGVAVLTAFPLLPLAGGRVLFALAPTTTGWQRARYQLEERNLGVVFSLVIVLLPLLASTGPIIGQLAAPLIGVLARLVGITAVVL